MTTHALPLYLDSTMLSCFRGCPRKFYNEFIRGLRGSGTSIHLHAGGCVAKTFEEVYNMVHIEKKPVAEAMRRAYIQYDIDWPDEIEPPFYISNKTGEKIYANAKTKDRVWEAIEGFFQKYPPLTDHIQPLQFQNRPTVEFIFAIPLTKDTLGYDVPTHPSGDPFLYSGRLDFLGHYQNVFLPLDHKTGMSMASNWAEQWDLRNQFLGYVWACGQLGIDVQRHFAVRGIIIQKTELRYPEAIKTYPIELLERWKGQVARDIHRIVDCYSSGYWDYDFAETCTAYGQCQFFHACRAADPENWLKDFVPRFWNPLAKNPVAEPPPAGFQPILPTL